MNPFAAAERIQRKAPVALAVWLALNLLSPARSLEPPQRKFAGATESKSEFDRVVTPFFTRHCLACHNPKKASGDLDLTALNPDMKASTSGARWAMLVEKLTNGQMPPKGRRRPNSAAVHAVLRWAHAEAGRAGKHFTRRAAHANGNAVPHHLLFDPKHIPLFDGGPRVRPLSPEIYFGFARDVGKGKAGLGQPFSDDREPVHDAAATGRLEARVVRHPRPHPEGPRSARAAVGAAGVTTNRDQP